MSSNKNKEYVVGMAQTKCNQGEKQVEFLAKDRRFAIRGEYAGTEADTSPANNFKGDYGYCKKLNGPCKKDFLPLWVNVCETVAYTDLTIADTTPMRNAIDQLMKYLIACAPNDEHTAVKKALEEIKDPNTLMVTMENLLGQGNYLDKENRHHQLRDDAKIALDKLSEIKMVSSSPPQRLILKSSLLVCWNGGVVSFADSGQSTVAGKQDWVDEKAHVIIYNRTDNWKISAVSTDNNETITSVNDLVSLYQNNEEKGYYDSHPYSFVGGHAELYAPFVFQKEGTNLSTTRFFDEDYQKSLPRYAKPNEGKAKQEDSAEKIKQLEQQCKTAVKLAYMVYGGDHAITKYQEDTAKEFEFLRQLNSEAYVLDLWGEDQGKITEKDKTYRNNYRDTFPACNYGLWGKYYRPADGWHRGIDMAGRKLRHLHTIHKSSGRAVIHSICEGYVIQVKDYYFSVYVPNGNVTITYMHLQQDGIGDPDQLAVTQAVEEYSVARDLEEQAVLRKKDLAMLWRKKMTGTWERGDAIQSDKLQQKLDDLKKPYKKAVEAFKAYFEAEKDNFAKLSVGTPVGSESDVEALGAVHTHIEFNSGFFNPNHIKRPGSTAKKSGYDLPNGLNGAKYDVDSFVDSDPAENGFSTNPYPIIEQIFKERMGD